MLADFQQALVELTASPALCNRVRQDPTFLRDLYQLTDREFHRLVGIVRDPGMACACAVYRANRLAPLAMNVPATCKALGPDLRAVMEDYWLKFPETNVHFYVETDRFCRFLHDEIAGGRPIAPAVDDALRRESEVVAIALAASRLEAHVRLPACS